MTSRNYLEVLIKFDVRIKLKKMLRLQVFGESLR